MAKKDEQYFDLSQITREDLYERPSKVGIELFGKPVKAGMSAAQWLDALPEILAGKQLRELAGAIATAHKAGRKVHLSMGAHVLKVGLAPLLIDLFEQGILTGLSVNGAVMIHDFEIAAAGKTSEDVDQVLGKGTFGTSEQTGSNLTEFIHSGSKQGLGLGQSVAKGIAEGDFPNKNLSLLASCYGAGIPVTAHPALGTDIAHLWPDLDWGLMGKAAKRDFLTFIKLVEDFHHSVYLNVGSAVLLPEVFLKAVTAVRNVGASHEGLVTANFDFIQHYRPVTNVVRRPTQLVGKGYQFTGHHEIMLPLLFLAVKEGLKGS